MRTKQLAAFLKQLTKNSYASLLHNLSALHARDSRIRDNNDASSVATPVSGESRANVPNNNTMGKQLMISKMDEICFSCCARQLRDLAVDTTNLLAFSLSPTNANGKLYIYLKSYSNGQVNDCTIELVPQIKLFICRELRCVVYSKNYLNLTGRPSYNDTSNIFLSSSIFLDDHKGSNEYSSDSARNGRGIDVFVSDGSKNNDEKKSSGAADRKYQGIIRIRTHTHEGNIAIYDCYHASTLTSIDETNCDASTKPNDDAIARTRAEVLECNSDCGDSVVTDHECDTHGKALCIHNPSTGCEINNKLSLLYHEIYMLPF